MIVAADTDGAVLAAPLGSAPIRVRPACYTHHHTARDDEAIIDINYTQQASTFHIASIEAIMMVSGHTLIMPRRLPSQSVEDPPKVVEASPIIHLSVCRVCIYVQCVSRMACICP